MNKKHYCHATCGQTCPPKHLMCSQCWKVVPRNLQLAVYRHYQPGQETGKHTPTKQWHEAADAAIKAVKAKRKNQ